MGREERRGRWASGLIRKEKGSWAERRGREGFGPKRKEGEFSISDLRNLNQGIKRNSKGD